MTINNTNVCCGGVVTKAEDSAGIVIEEAEIVDCDGVEKKIHNVSDICFIADEALDPLAGDTVDTEDGIRYQEALAYRVVQVNGNSVANEIELPVAQQGNGAVQVLTSPINGQFYVIGNANDVFSTAQGTRSLTPRNMQIDTPRTATPGLKKRDDRRRATHNEVERRRRDKINNWIAKLGKIIPECNTHTNGNGNGNSSGEGKVNYETQSKGGILAKACEYITELRNANQGLSQCLKENEKLRQEVTALKQVLTQLKRENAQLRSGGLTNTQLDP
ncbi:upstream stimulatory factor 1 isoform X2 [Diachasmimorpha longicaudata]|uniref:upstream stimulatory factor 1 isoform X2 n=1 Tax=Diachasmimorpha longicaudata TaxID=58733 RepID=UPI0030B8CD77